MTTPRNTTLNLLAIAILCSATACSDATGPDGDPRPEAPEAQFETVTDVTLTLRYLRVSAHSACDGVAVISREPRNGEFQYRVEGYRNGTRLETLQSSRYGSVTGAATSAGPGETIQFANQTWSFDALRSGDQVELRLRARGPTSKPWPSTCPRLTSTPCAPTSLGPPWSSTTSTWSS